MTCHGLTGSIPPWTKERRLAASEVADQVAKSRWLRIQCVNHVFALTLKKNDILNLPKPYTGEDKRTDKERLDERFKASLWR
jgi:hypothetical protein